MAASRATARLFSRSFTRAQPATHTRPCTYPTRPVRLLSTTPLRSSAAEVRSEDEGKTHTAGPKYTTDAYPNLQRHSHFAKLNNDHVSTFRNILSGEPDSALLYNNAEDVDPFNTDWMRKYRGHGSLVLRPSTTAQVSEILKYCNSQKLAVVPQAGNTGLVGGSVPVFDEIVLSLGRMNKIRSFDSTSGILVADSGVVLEVADNYLAERGHIFPLDLGAKGSCMLGGIVATNAGGLRLLRYGSLHGNVLGIEAVLPDGTIVDDLSKLRKNNTGYDVKQLFIGGEGTLGVVTGVSVLCPQRSSSVNVAAFGVSSFEKCLEAFKAAKGQLGEIISAFEFTDRRSQELLKYAKGLSLPLEGEHPFYVIVETSGSNAEHDQEKLEGFLNHVMETEIVADGVVAQDATQAKNLWSCREGVPEALGHFGGIYKYDLSVPLECLYDLVTEARTRLRDRGLLGDGDNYPVVDAVGYGHLGDGNLHLNVPTREFSKDIEEALEPWVFEWVSKRNGSISAEHGLGLAKKPFISYSRSDKMVELMKGVKAAWDPVSGRISYSGMCAEAKR